VITPKAIQFWLTACYVRRKDNLEHYTLINESWDHEINKIVPGQFNYGFWGDNS